MQKNKTKSKTYPHFRQKKRALPQFSEKSLIETAPFFCMMKPCREGLLLCNKSSKKAGDFDFPRTPLKRLRGNAPGPLLV